MAWEDIPGRVTNILVPPTAGVYRCVLHNALRITTQPQNSLVFRPTPIALSVYAIEGAATIESDAVYAAFFDQPEDVAIWEGEDALFTTSDNPIGCTYQWQGWHIVYTSGWEDLPGETNYELLIEEVTRTAYNGWKFRVAITAPDAVTTITSREVLLTVYGLIEETIPEVVLNFTPGTFTPVIRETALYETLPEIVLNFEPGTITGEVEEE